MLILSHFLLTYSAFSGIMNESCVKILDKKTEMDDNDKKENSFDRLRLCYGYELLRRNAGCLFIGRGRHHGKRCYGNGESADKAHQRIKQI